MSFLRSYIHYLADQIEHRIEDVVIEYLPKNSTAVLLDCGCDDGDKAVNRAKAVGITKLLGLENIPARAKLASKRGVEVKIADLNTTWPIKTKSVDCVVATEVVEHLINLDNFFSESSRVLKKEGRIIVSTENLAAWHNILALLVGNQPYTGPYLSKIYPIGHHPSGNYYQHLLPMDPHLNVMTLKSLIQLLKNYGFKVIAYQGVGFYPVPRPVADLLATLDFYHSSYGVVVGQK